VKPLVVLLAALLVAAPAAASERHPTLSELESEVICPTCHEPLDQSSAPIADRIRQFIRARIAAGDTKSQIEQKLVAQFGPQVLASPPHKGFDLLAWWLPIAGVVAGGAVLAWLAWRWSRSREPAPAPAPVRLDPELERRLDEELARFED
jgi:cytochrome c-type biogenesis protein CcmH